MQQKRGSLKVIILLLAILLSLGVVLLVGNRVFNLMAKAGGSAPTNVQLTEITANSALITFTTQEASQALVEYGTNPSNLTLFASDSTSTMDHKIHLTLLTASTTYYAKVKIGSDSYDNSGLPWTFTTAGGNNSLVSTPSVSPAISRSPLLNRAISPTVSQISTAPRADCGGIGSRIGATRGSARYEEQYDINKDGIINAADVVLCK